MTLYSPGGRIAPATGPGPRSAGRGPSTVVEVFADIWCPFAHVGLRRTVERRARLTGHDFLLDVRAWPLELVNGVPLDPDATARHVSELQSQVAPDLFRGFDPGHFPTTSLPALASAHTAYGRDPRTGESVSLALRDALFEQGLDISRPEVMAEIVARLGRAAVRPRRRAGGPRRLAGGGGTRRAGLPPLLLRGHRGLLSLPRHLEGRGRSPRGAVDLDALDTFLSRLLRRLRGPSGPVVARRAPRTWRPRSRSGSCATTAAPSCVGSTRASPTS